MGWASTNVGRNAGPGIPYENPENKNRLIAMTPPWIRAKLLLAASLPLLLFLSGCSMNRLAVIGAEPILAGGQAAMYRETDLKLARDAMPAQLVLIQGLLQEDPHNPRLLLYAARGFYGYTFGFVEDHDRRRASKLYERCFHYGLAALREEGLDLDPQRAQQQQVQAAVARLGRSAVPALFWTASCWAKWIDMNRDDPARIAELGRTAVLMRRVLKLDEGYFHGGADLFFGVYYGGRPPMLGGDYRKARRYFERAERISDGKLFLVDVLYAEYLARQTQNRALFEKKLHSVLSRPADEVPDLALFNRIAQAKARRLLAHEKDYF